LLNVKSASKVSKVLYYQNRNMHIFDLCVDFVLRIERRITLEFMASQIRLSAKFLAIVNVNKWLLLRLSLQLKHYGDDFLSVLCT